MGKTAKIQEQLEGEEGRKEEKRRDLSSRGKSAISCGSTRVMGDFCTVLIV